MQASPFSTPRPSPFLPALIRAMPVAGALCLAGLTAACATRERPAIQTRGSAGVANASAPDVPHFSGLGDHARPITTASPEAQRFFDQGLAFLYAFNHDEAERAFARCAALDPASAMCRWGEAMAQGPHINNAFVDDEKGARAVALAAEARERAGKAGTAVERALIAALEKRHAAPAPSPRTPLDQAYADAMRAVFEAHPDDTDVGALYAEALLDLRPWDQWTPDGRPQPGTEEVLRVLEHVLRIDPRHPLAAHLMIHATEAGPAPERADAAASALRDLAPGLGHLVHMPSHIDVRLGRWREAIASNERAIAADRAYVAQRAEQAFYRLYMAHNHHMLAFAAMMLGRRELSASTIDAMLAQMPLAWVKDGGGFADGYVGMPFEVMLRFGAWDDILRAPEPPAYLPIARALRLYARGVALGATGDVEGGRREQAAFRAQVATVPEDAFFGNNSGRDLLAVAEHVLEGELSFFEGRHEVGIASLREAVRREDALRYDEPPDWIQPVRHALGAALVRTERLQEAEAVFREDLRRLPGNVWSLHGLARTLRAQDRGGDAAEIERQLAAALEGADVKLTSSCMCLPGI